MRYLCYQSRPNLVPAVAVIRGGFPLSVINGPKESLGSPVSLRKLDEEICSLITGY